VFAAVASAGAQSWEGGRTTPSLWELVAVDRTGEDGWPFGAEDVADDGADRFQPPEQAIDIRTLYATTSADQFWARLYVSDATGPGGNVTAFVFIDTDRDPDTGGDAAGAELSDSFDSDASGGGYESVVAVAGNGDVDGIWEWQTDHWEPLPQADVNAAEGEVGADADPIRWGGLEHGYLQCVVDLASVGLDAACDARLYARTVNDTGTVGDGDLEVGEVGPCVPGDTNSDRVPDVVIPPDGCDDDADCPGEGICVNGRCVLAPPCDADNDCDAGESCIDHHCVAQGGEACEDDGDCDGLVCDNGECRPCTDAGVDCPDGTVCAPDGRCVDEEAPPGTGGSGSGGSGPGESGEAGSLLGPGEEIEGGAGTCSLGHGYGPWRLWIAALGLSLWGLHRRRRHLSC